MYRRDFLAAAAMTAAPFFSIAAETWPNRPLRILIGFPPGGSADSIGRALAGALPKVLGQSAVVHNRPGASSLIAAEAVINATDGHTVLLHPAGLHAIRPYVTNMRFDPWKELLPLTTLAEVPTVFVCSSKRPYRSLTDVVAYAREHPGKLNMGMAGNATLTHLTSELLRTEADFNAVAVPFGGAGPALNAMLAGDVDIVNLDVSSAIGQITGGYARGLAVAAGQRYPFLPDVPTTSEAGFEKVLGANAYGLHTPASMPVENREKLLGAVHAALKDPELDKLFRAIGLVPQGSTPAQFTAMARADEARFAPLIKRLGLRMQ